MPFDPNDQRNDETEEESLAQGVHDMVCGGVIVHRGMEHAELCELATAQARHVRHLEQQCREALDLLREVAKPDVDPVRLSWLSGRVHAWLVMQGEATSRTVGS